MDYSEELARLETFDVAHSQRLVQKWRSALETAHPELLYALMEHHLLTESRPALKVLLGVKESHSQVFFDKLNECLLRRATRLASLRLLAEMLNGQVTWLYKIVQHPLFQTLLQLLKLNHDLLVLTQAVFVMTVLLPLAPYRVSGHLPDLYEAFTRVATLKSNEEMKRTPAELFLVLDVAVYYLFLQLYSLFPCGFVQYLKGRFGPTGEVALYQEHIAPLFSHVQLHPSLVTELPQQETKKSKWSLWEPHDLATYSLSLSLDPFLVSLDDPSPADKLIEWRQAQLSSTINTPSSPPPVSIPPDLTMCGALSAEKMAELWTPSLAFGQLGSGEVSRTSSRMTSLSSPFMEPLSSAASQQHTPVALTQPSFKYSPTASVEVDKPMGRAMESPSRSQSGTTSPTRAYHVQNGPPPVKSSFRTRIANMFGRRASKEATVQAERAQYTGSKSNSLTQSAELHRNEAEVFREQDFLRSLQLPLDSSTSHRVCRQGSSSSTSSDEWPSRELDSLPEQPSNLAHTSFSTEDTIARTSFSTEDTITSSLLLTQRLQELAESVECDEEGSQREEERTEHSKLNLSHDPSSIIETSDMQTPISDLSSCLLSRSVLPSKRKRASNSTSSVSFSPVAILEQYINSGLLLHSGKGAVHVPLPDTEGIDWNHFGGCPHSEELGVMTAYVALLHSQVMFERYQCQQHARRNRRLLSKARTASKLENEIVTLRDQLHQQNNHISILEQELELSKRNATSTTNDLVKENTALKATNRVLKENVACYQKQVDELSSDMERLEKELREAKQQVFILATEKEATQERLSEADQLESEMGQLLQEHLLLEEVYQQQQVSLAAIRCEDTRSQHLSLLNEALTKEKNNLESVVSSLQLRVDKLSAELREQGHLLQSREKEIACLKSSHEQLQSRSNERIKSVEDKYSTVKVLNQKLESAILSLHGRTGVSHTDTTSS